MLFQSPGEGPKSDLPGAVIAEIIVDHISVNKGRPDIAGIVHTEQCVFETVHKSFWEREFIFGAGGLSDADRYLAGICISFPQIEYGVVCIQKFCYAEEFRFFFCAAPGMYDHPDP